MTIHGSRVWALCEWYIIIIVITLHSVTAECGAAVWVGRAPGSVSNSGLVTVGPVRGSWGLAHRMLKWSWYRAFVVAVTGIVVLGGTLWRGRKRRDWVAKAGVWVIYLFGRTYNWYARAARRMATLPRRTSDSSGSLPVGTANVQRFVAACKTRAPIFFATSSQNFSGTD